MRTSHALILIALAASLSQESYADAPQPPASAQPPAPAAPRKVPAVTVSPRPTSGPSAPALDTMSDAFLLGVLLHTPLDVQFQETPVREALATIQGALEIPIIARYRGQAEMRGLDPESPVTLQVRGQVALDVLESVLAQACSDEACTWQLRRGFVEVGPKSRLNSAPETRVYPINDLLLEPPRFGDAPELGLPAGVPVSWNGSFEFVDFGGQRLFLHRHLPNVNSTPYQSRRGSQQRKMPAELAQQLVDIITATIEPKAWDVNGGDVAVIRYYTQGGLVISAPDYIHRQVGGTVKPLSPAQILKARQAAAEAAQADSARSTPAPAPAPAEPQGDGPALPRPGPRPAPSQAPPPGGRPPG